MGIERIDVIFYAGRKGDDRPVTCILRGLRIDLVGIVDCWIGEGFRDRRRKRYFSVKGSDGTNHRIYYDEDILEWYHAS